MSDNTAKTLVRYVAHLSLMGLLLWGLYWVGLSEKPTWNDFSQAIAFLALWLLCKKDDVNAG